MELAKVQQEIRQLLPNHHKLFEISEHPSMGSNGTKEIRATLRFGAQTVIRKDPTPLKVQLRELAIMMLEKVGNDLEKVTDELK